MVERQKADVLFDSHPAVTFLYFGLMLWYSVWFLHPLCLLFSFGGALAYRIDLGGTGTVRMAALLVPALLLPALLNPLLNHAGMRVLFYLPSGNPLTLESVIYGAASAVMLASVLLWFSCYASVVCSDKFIYLFGRMLPVLSLMLSMTLRFIPEFAARIRETAAAQKGLGHDLRKGSLLQRGKAGMELFSIVTTWALEHAGETAVSMKSRGYGLPGRTAFSLYRMSERDRELLLWFGFCGSYIFCGWASKQLEFQYFPQIAAGNFSPMTASVWLVYALFCLTPVILNGKERRKWKHFS